MKDPNHIDLDARDRAMDKPIWLRPPSSIERTRSYYHRRARRAGRRALKRDLREQVVHADLVTE